MDFKDLLPGEDEKRRLNEEKPKKKFDDRFDNEYYLYYEPPRAGSNFHTGRFEYYRNTKSNFIIYTVGSLIFIILFLIVGIIFFQDNFSGYFGSKKLDAEIIETEYYYDNISFVKDEKMLLTGMKFFYRKTGVQPVLLTCEYDPRFESIDERIAFLLSQYDELFSDEAHLLIIYFEGEGDSPETLCGNFRVTLGYDAKENIDDSTRGYLVNTINLLKERETIEITVARALELTAKDI